MKQCRYCEDVRRTWVVREGDQFCGLCGQALRAVAVLPAGVPASAGRAGGGPSARPAPWSWLVPPGAGADAAAARTALAVHSIGCFAARVTGVEVLTFADGVAVPAGPGAASVVDFHQPTAVEPDGTLPLTLALGAESAGVRRELRVRVSGDFPTQEMVVHVGAAPQRFAAWAVEGPDGATAKPPADHATGELAGKGGELRWELGEMVLLPWRSGRARFALMADARSWGGGAPFTLSVDPRQITWVPDADTPADLTVTHDATWQYPLQFAVESPGLVREVRGRLRLVLDLIGRPVVELKLRLVPGRPEFAWVERPGASKVLQLPAGYPSSIPLELAELAPVGDGEAEALRPLAEGLARRKAFVLDARCGDRDVLLRPGPQRPQPPDDLDHLHFRLRAHMPPACGSVQLTLSLAAHLPDNTRLPLSEPRALTVNVVDSAHRTSGRTLVIDFGTTNTCICPAESKTPSYPCLKLPELAGSGADADIVPTLLWLGPAPDGPGAATAPPPAARAPAAGGAPRPATTHRDPIADGELSILIGAPALRHVSGAGELFRHFKPEVGLDGEPVQVAAAHGKQVLLSKTDLGRLFLRELILEARAQGGGTPDEPPHGPIANLYVTCPSTFNSRQREALKAILADLRDYGITGESALRLDEANAGAFTDLRKHLREGDRDPSKPVHVMIFDLGGGTIDTALIRAHPKPRDNGQVIDYHLEPLGVTGLRDFAGWKTTDAIARLLAAKLYAHLYKPQGAGPNAQPPRMQTVQPGWVPLPFMAELKTNRKAGIEAAVRKNHDALRELAEQVKRVAYGSYLAEDGQALVDCAQKGWQSRLRQPLLGAMLETTFGQALNLRRVTSLGGMGAEPVIGDVAPHEWRAWLGAIKLTRAEVDAEVRPAFDEAVDRARNLWLAAGPAGEGHLPDLLLLAGGSSQLPLIRQVIEERLGFPAGQIHFDERSAKRKVAQGCAVYADVANGAWRDFVVHVPEDASDFLLIPIVCNEDGHVDTIFPLPYRLSTNEFADRQYHVAGERLDMWVYENVDYRRDNHWEPSAKLQELGVTSPGKERLAKLCLRLGQRGTAKVRHRLRHDKGRLARVLVVEFDGPRGPQTEEAEI